jgi:hypothetical protein
LKESGHCKKVYATSNILWGGGGEEAKESKSEELGTNISLKY